MGKNNKHNLDLDIKEYCLILAMRNRFRYGDLVVTMRDGLPQYIKHAWESDDLDSPIDKE